MKKILLITVFALFVFSITEVNGQKVNGKQFAFPNGRTEWSDTVYKKLLTKPMIRKGIRPVEIGIRYKFVQSGDEGNWYNLEITNLSPATKIRFRISANQNRDSYRVRLAPRQNRVVERLYWRPRDLSPDPESTTAEGEYINSLFDEVLQERY